MLERKTKKNIFKFLEFCKKWLTKSQKSGRISSGGLKLQGQEADGGSLASFGNEVSM